MKHTMKPRAGSPIDQAQAALISPRHPQELDKYKNIFEFMFNLFYFLGLGAWDPWRIPPSIFLYCYKGNRGTYTHCATDFQRRLSSDNLGESREREP